MLKKLPTYLKMNLVVPDEYVDKFICANNTFLYQLVFDPLQRKMIPLHPYPPDVDSSQLDYAGQYPYSVVLAFTVLSKRSLAGPFFLYLFSVFTRVTFPSSEFSSTLP